MKKKILLLTDFSETSYNAIAYALELFKTERCDFYVLNVFKTVYNLIEDIIPPKPREKGYDEPKEKSLLGLDRVSKRIESKEEQNPFHQFNYLSLNGESLLNIVDEVVEQKDIEMVIMATKGLTDDKSSVFGSNAIQIMEKIRNCPVLVVPKKAQKKIPKEIVFPTSYRTHYKKRELTYLIDIVRTCNASLRVLHITNNDDIDKNQKERKEMLEEYFEGLNYSFHSLSCITVSMAIKCFVESRDSDMVAFINKKHAFFDTIFSKPLVKEVGYKLKVPVLVLHDLRN
ncbi:universal stress protein [Tenacibaculum caenipelagi]|uniref:Nucleotide-binding universal stress UspA family protein n=1 Tax=Tenacibaculum caenipelagi TaxID=1325435 RepID=A0A4R6TEM3_9FLAO|nr:universal stress protein [Tenacibaculum caenipelagi]TDQ21967.1 nucleotide-binding universal stress UspA family protein [Tenacibaculum caenipelagi]